jgi:hypothetical protein
VIDLNDIKNKGHAHERTRVMSLNILSQMKNINGRRTLTEAGQCSGTVARGACPGVRLGREVTAARAPIGELRGRPLRDGRPRGERR